MFGSIGGGEVILLLVLALLVFGPRKLPGIGRTIGSALAEFRRATNEFKRNLEREVDQGEVRSVTSEIRETAEEVRNVARGSLSLEAPPPADGPPGKPSSSGPDEQDGADDSSDDAKPGT